jgi:5-methylthioadenosine/S-adenosylhomocysteine deaminase
VSNVVYAAGSDCVDTVVCDGRIVMEGRRVPGEAEILENAAKEAAKLVGAR